MTRQPPSSPEAEAAVLGSCMLDPVTCIHLCKELGVRPEHFYSPQHAKVWDAIERTFDKHSTTDVTLVQSDLKDNDELDHIGGALALDMLVDETSTAAHCEYYLDILCNKYELRRQIKIHREGEERAYEADADPKELITSSMSAMMRSMDKKEKKSPEDHHAEHIRRRELAKKQGYVGTPSKWKMVNNLINSYIPPDNVVIAAKSSLGKTDLLINEFIHAALMGIPCFLYSLEMSEYQLRERMASMLSEINAFFFGGAGWSDNDAKKMDEGYKQLAKLPIYIEHNPYGGIKDFRISCARMKAKYGVVLCGVDYLQLFSLTAAEHRQDYRLVVGEHSKIIKGIGSDLDVVSFLVSQLKRYGVDSKKDLTPVLPNKELLKEAGEIENNADIIIMPAQLPGVSKTLYTYLHPLWDYVWVLDKARNGPTGRFNMTFWPSRHQFMSTEEGFVIQEEYDTRKEEAKKK